MHHNLNLQQMTSTIFSGIYMGLRMNDRRRDNQGIHGHLGEIQHELQDLADYIRKKEAPTVVPLSGSRTVPLAEAVLYLCLNLWST